MSESAPTPPSSSKSRGRGRGSRGGLGKYLRARGRRGGGRPAEFRERLLLEDESKSTLNDEEAEAAAAELAAKFSRRKLGTNADRYVEAEPELGSDGEPIVEPEVDLSTFLKRQRITDDKIPSILKDPQSQINDDDVDHTLDHLPTSSTSRSSRQPIVPKKGKVETLEWDEEFENMAREKAAAEANWELKERFRAKTEKLRGKAIASGVKPRKANNVTEAPELPSSAPPKAEKAQMEDFLDDLLG